MDYRYAVVSDIPNIRALQSRYHVSTISEADRPSGFVTTLFTDEQFTSLIERENGLSVACDGDRVVAYAMAASWRFWSAWPLFVHMIADLPTVSFLGRTLNIENSYQYGPVCIDAASRGRGVLENVFEHSRRGMACRFAVTVTFINHVNPRSYKAHTAKVGMTPIKDFQFNGQTYYELAYDTSRPVAGATLV